jgi:hypothetical protein
MLRLGPASYLAAAVMAVCNPSKPQIEYLIVHLQKMERGIDARLIFSEFETMDSLEHTPQIDGPFEELSCEDASPAHVRDRARSLKHAG